ncbi:remorin 1.4-like isoform X2 [Macadamia integrifolia]|uniref:remorin 1.4-like isoform X2 n=1 Tax=Macadamia integrifolia TaxID=60698 RepID=UPI001C4F4A29|nr:remorin 1.4-like isoform X2 [Macadamia integrifolia]
MTSGRISQQEQEVHNPKQILGWKLRWPRLKKRYEKMNSTIQAWEEEKKKKARRRLDRKEGELEQRRARVLQQHRVEIQRINQIVGGAKAQAEEKRRNDEQLKAKEKANKIRATGKVPATCFFF